LENALGEGTSAVIASASTIASFVARALGTEAAFASRLRLTRGGITVVEFAGESPARLACLNYTAHLS
jgi:broad specificity phosphatase PhoE